MAGSMVFCRGCGKEIHETAINCPQCGAVQGIQGFSGNQFKIKTTAAIWCFFLGSIGAHRFYLGKTTDAVLRALFCWTLIPSMIASVEILILAFTDDDNREWDMEYNNGIQTPPTHFIIKILAILSILAGIFEAILFFAMINK